MNRYSEIWRIMAILGTGYPIVINSLQVRLKSLRMTYVASQWHILHNNGIYWSHMTCCRQWWPTVIKNIKFERDSPLQDRIEWPRSSISGYGMKALWDKIGQIWSKVAYNGPVFVIVSRDDILGPCLTLYYHLWIILAFYVKYDHIMIKVPRKRESGQKYSIIIQYEPL